MGALLVFGQVKSKGTDPVDQKARNLGTLKRGSTTSELTSNNAQ